MLHSDELLLLIIINTTIAGPFHHYGILGDGLCMQAAWTKTMHQIVMTKNNLCTEKDKHYLLQNLASTCISSLLYNNSTSTILAKQDSTHVLLKLSVEEWLLKPSKP